uniref:Uncharacterized protein n=1 Tax=Siphoviridae sp. ctWWc42 TaxID=2826361 RepID=A0A8S5R252_9CAUD|nr:MAG TPA: hypothetical protein [Siphoviridae sp. ctWWc42]
MNTALAIIAFVSIIMVCIAVVIAIFIVVWCIFDIFEEAWDDVKSFYEEIFHKYF